LPKTVTNSPIRSPCPRQSRNNIWASKTEQLLNRRRPMAKLGIHPWTESKTRQYQLSRNSSKMSI